MTAVLPSTLGVILAGGLAHRMGGGDKALIEIAGQTILSRELSRIQPQCARVILNANGAPSRFASFGLPVVADDVPDFAGPLAGILGALDWAVANEPSIEWVLSVPGDCPFLPSDLAVRLHQVRLKEGKPIACAASGGRHHPVIALWNVTLRDDLRRALTVEHVRKVEVFATRHDAAFAEWPDKPVDPFFNVNSREDAERAARIAREQNA